MFSLTRGIYNFLKIPEKEITLGVSRREMGRGEQGIGERQSKSINIRVIR